MSIYQSTAHDRAAGPCGHGAWSRATARGHDRRHGRSVSTDSSDPACCPPIDRACPRGVALMTLYITILGAGSTVFARQLMTDILQIEGLDEGCFALVDIDASRLELAHQVAERLITRSGKHWSVRASTERRDLLAGSDFIINTIE